MNKEYLIQLWENDSVATYKLVTIPELMQEIDHCLSTNQKFAVYEAVCLLDRS